MRSPSAAALYERGIALRQAGRIPEAVRAYEDALGLQPEFPEAENNLGNCLRLLWRLDEAAAAFRRALALRPRFAEAWNNLGAALKNMGRMEEAAQCLERAVELQPDNAALHSNYVYALHYGPADDPERCRREAERWSRRHGARLFPNGDRLFPNDPTPDRRLRIGYVSAGFREQCQSFFTVPLFAHHDHAACDVFAYADVAAPDAITERLRRHADHWRTTSGLSDEALAASIRSDRIDILVDLTVHAANNRLRVFARKPAPVQVSWLGYPGTTGLPTVDWRLTDPWLDPVGEADAAYTEKSWRLPDTFWCYDPLTGQPPVTALPAERNGFVTFGCLNNFSKVNDGCLDRWGRVLRALPGSRLRLLAPPGEARARVIGRLEVAPERIEFADFLPRPLYLASYGEIDLGLDTFPCNGHTTSLDSWWMGVPVVTLAGRSAVSRAGLSQASNLGLAADFAARSPDEFVSLALARAADLPALAARRATLRRRLEASPLMNAPRFAAAVETAYRSMWRDWCAAQRTA